MAKVRTSNPDSTISLKRLQCVVGNNKYKIKLMDESITKDVKNNSGIKIYLKSIQQAHRIKKFCLFYCRIKTQKYPKRNRQ